MQLVDNAKNLLEEIITEKINTYDLVEQIHQKVKLYLSNKKDIFMRKVALGNTPI